jgi:hypothetical protein
MADFVFVSSSSPAMWSPVQAAARTPAAWSEVPSSGRTSERQAPGQVWSSAESLTSGIARGRGSVRRGIRGTHAMRAAGPGPDATEPPGRTLRRPSQAPAALTSTAQQTRHNIDAVAAPARQRPSVRPASALIEAAVNAISDNGGGQVAAAGREQNASARCGPWISSIRPWSTWPPIPALLAEAAVPIVAESGKDCPTPRSQGSSMSARPPPRPTSAARCLLQLPGRAVEAGSRRPGRPLPARAWRR